VNRSAEPVGFVAFRVLTVTSTTPDPAGETAVIDVAELTVKLVALVEPNLTAVAPLNPVPVIVTEVPPPAGPLLGSTLVTVRVVFAASAGPASAIETTATRTATISGGPCRRRRL
jgi:hypothetical protein